MKKILILLLLSSIICQSSNPIQEIKDIIGCISKSNLLDVSLEKIKEALNSKDPSDISKILISLITKLKDEIIQCKEKQLRKLSNEDDEYDDVKLGYPKYVYVLYTQIGKDAFTWFDKGGITLLKEQCHKYYGQKTWFCVYLAEN